MPAGFIDAHIALGFGDPGGVDPVTLRPPNPVTEQWYDSLPEVYRAADTEDTSTSTGYPLWGYLDAMTSVLTEPLRLGEIIASGGLTDPSVAPDEWIPWMAQVMGVIGKGIPEQRALLANLVNAPPLGSRHYMEVLTQRFLTGTKNVQVTAVAPWGIRVRVRSEETLAAGGVDGITEKLYATGLVPAGFQLLVTADQETWAQVDESMPTWAAGEGKTWARILSMGLTGSGIVSGTARWVGTAAGVRP